jgi:hypothetical protein
MHTKLSRKREWKRALGRPRRRWESNTDSGQSPLTDSCEHGNEPSGSINGGGFIDQLSDY